MKEHEILSPEIIEKQSVRREEMRADILRPLQQSGMWGKVWIAFLVVILLIGCYAYFLQLKHGLIETGLRDYATWGIYISNFVFFVAISLVGALISSVLRLTNFTWYRPLTRIAEIIAVAGVVWAGLIIIIDMGRPDRILNLFLHPRIQSPILWDVVVISTYLTTSVLLLYLPLLPGIAICRNTLTNKPKWQRWMYKFLALGWTGTPEQWKIMKRSISILCVVIIPLAISIHTVTSWLFATTLRPGWDSTNFGPYFVAGAFLAGTACVIIGMFVFRKAYSLEKYITEEHFSHMGKLLVFLSLVYAYFNINEYFVPYYKMRGPEAKLLTDLFSGQFAGLYWGAQILGLAIPVILLLFKPFRKPLPLTLIAIPVVVFAWVKRYLIVTPILVHPYLPIQNVPDSWKNYFPSWVEISIVSASLAGVLLIITLFSRFFPIISIWETLENEGIELDELDKLKNEKA